MSSADQDAIKKEAIIFRQKGERQITRFQALVNDAAQELCLKSPALIAKKGVLLNMAQEKVRNSGYQFKKGKSRSKKAASQAPLPKRTKITPDLRAQRISYLQEDIKDINDQLSFKQKRCDIAASVENYKLCDVLNTCVPCSIIQLLVLQYYYVFTCFIKPGILGFSTLIFV